MTPAEAASLLTIAAAYDNRKPDADTAKAWSMALDGLRFEDCRTAVVEHYRASTDWMMPAHVVTRVKRMRHDRLREFGHLPDPPASIDPGNTAAYSRWLRETNAAIADGTYVAPAEASVTGRRDVIRELGQAGQAIPDA